MKIQSAKAGIGTGRAGLQAASGLFSSAGLFDKGVKSFNPLDLDPYLLFDARTSMIGTLENPTLDLDPSKQDTLDVITATRAGTATYTDFNGLIATAPANTVRVDQTQGAELTPTKFQHIGYTDFSQGWTLQAGITLNSNTTETVSPEGQNNAAKVVSTDNTKGFFFGGLNLSVAAIRTIYLKGASGGETITLKDPSGYGTPIVHTLTTDWVRYEMATTNDGNSYQGLFIDDISVGTIYAYGPQLEEGTTASSFVANTTGSPKFITGATYGPRVPMILVEPSATNLVAYSEDFSISWWTKSGVSVVSEETSAPDGSSNVFKVVENTSTSAHSVFRNAATVTLNAHSFSIIAKTNGRNLGLDFFGGTNSAKFDLTSGSVISTTGSGLTASIEPIGGGWFRCSITQVQTSTTIYPNIFCLDDSNNISYQGDGTSGIYVWGAQLETGSVSTSYIPTSGSTAQRAADDLVISGSDFDFYNQSEGTVYFEGNSNGTTDPRLFEFSDGTTSNRTKIDINDGSNFRTSVVNNGSVIVSEEVSFTDAESLFRAALSFKVNDLEGNLNGVSVINETPASLPTLDQLHVGSNHDGGANYLNGHIKRLIYWPYHSDSL